MYVDRLYDCIPYYNSMVEFSKGVIDEELNSKPLVLRTRDKYKESPFIPLHLTHPFNRGTPVILNIITDE